MHTKAPFCFSPVHSHLKKSSTSTTLALEQKSAWTMSFVSSSLDVVAQLQLKWQWPEVAYAYRTVSFCSNEYVKEFTVFKKTWNDMTCYCPAWWNWTTIKKHLKISTEKMEWRTRLKIHRLVLTVENKFMVLREFGRTTPQIHNHDMYDKWRETRLKVRMTERCCKMVEAIVYNSKNRKRKPNTKWKNNGWDRWDPAIFPRSRTAPTQKVRLIEIERNWRHEANKLALQDPAVSMIETWTCFSSGHTRSHQESRRAQRAKCWFHYVTNGKRH